MFCGRNEETGQAVAKEFNATFIKVDVTDAAQVESFFNQVLDHFNDGFNVADIDLTSYMDDNCWWQIFDIGDRKLF